MLSRGAEGWVGKSGSSLHLSFFIFNKRVLSGGAYKYVYRWKTLSLLYKKDDLRTRISDFRTAKLGDQLIGLYFKNLKSLIAIRKSNHITVACNRLDTPLMLECHIRQHSKIPKNTTVQGNPAIAGPHTFINIHTDSIQATCRENAIHRTLFY